MLRAIILLVTVACFVIPVFVQADTTWVELDKYMENNNLTETIEGDTLADGSRANPDRVYGLRNGGWYYLTGRIRNIGYHLRVTGEPRSDVLHPPIILMKVDGIGESDNPMFEASGDISISDVYILGTDAIGLVSRRCIVGQIDDITVKVNNCIFEYGNQSIYTQKTGMSVFATNNIIVNLMEIGNKSTNYRFWLQTKKVASDTIWIENNSFINCPGAPFAVSKVEDAIQSYFYYANNTYVNGSCQTFHFPYWVNAVFKNNIWYNPLSMGDPEEQRFKQLADEAPFVVIQVDTIGADTIITEAARVIDINNNAWFVHADVLKMQADSSHKTSPIDFIGAREVGMFGDDATWPGLNFDAATLHNADPMFNNFNDDREQFIAFNAAFLVKPYPTLTDNTFDFGWGDPAMEPFDINWPIADNLLSVHNPTLVTAADDGGVLGDRRWAPGVVNSVDQASSLPSGFGLSQNYPNPFNPTTSISYHLGNATDVKLEVFNMLGQKVNTLVNAKQNAGPYTVEWNGTDVNGDLAANGVYVYRLQVGAENQYRKMTMMK